MQRIIEAIEEKMGHQEATISIQRREIERLKKELDDAKATIEKQEKLIFHLEGNK